MSSAEAEVITGGDRLERFRELRARLDPAGDPARPLAHGLYVPQSRSVSSRIAAELALSPASTHLLVGGVGSGKTTELLAVREALRNIPDTRAFYIDVSKRHDIGKMVVGVVAVQVGLALGESLESTGPADGKKVIEQHVTRLLAQGAGYWTDLDDDADEGIFVPGLLIPPDQVEESVQRAMEPAMALLDVLRRAHRHVIVLLDGLDRMTDMAAFEQLIEHDVKALASAGIGVVLAGPLKSLYGIERTLTQRFDRFHYQPWMDLAADPEAHSFMIDVLKRRVPEDALPPRERETLVRSSGGVLRDVLALAQLACVEAYIDGSDVIGPTEVERAVDAFGRKHMQGLRAPEIEVLQRVRIAGGSPA
ncbi:hypothetical protein [Sorangium sp. So ce854]|uniref:hypothetical protein n=1 Tax=Sorangium sp. So ce854 TaxID=3133322 RepID=UPI003F613DAC